MSRSKKKQKAAEAAAELERAAAELEAAAAEAAEPAEAPKKKRHPVRKLFFVAIIGATVAMVVSEDARKGVLDALFGAEEEFQYTAQAAGASSNGQS